MSDFMESIFDSINIITEKKLEDLPYDKTIVCTIVNNDNSKNGEYRVTNGSSTYMVYSDVDKYKVGDQVRVLIPQNNYASKKFIIGKYVEDAKSSPLTYVSPLETVVNVTGNLINNNEAQQEYGIEANGPIDSKIIWNTESFPLNTFNLLDSGEVYNTIILKADFKTLMQNDKYIEGTYGLKLSLKVAPNKNSEKYVVWTLDLSNKDMFGNSYNFTIYSPQAKTITISSIGTIIGAEISLYQNSDFKNENGVLGNFKGKDNIFVKNLEFGFGSDLTNITDNTVRIYSEDSLIYKWHPHNNESNLKKIGLVWYNKDENNKYIGFSDGVYDPHYNEFTYLEKSTYDAALLDKKNSPDYKGPCDEIGLTLATHSDKTQTLLTSIRDLINHDLNNELSMYARKFQGFNSDTPEYALKENIESLQDIVADDLLDKLDEESENLKSIYDKILSFGLIEKKEEIEQDDKQITQNDIDALDTENLNSILNAGFIIIKTKPNDVVIPSNYAESYNNLIIHINRIQTRINKIITEQLDPIFTEDKKLVAPYVDSIKNSIEKGEKLEVYGEQDLSIYDNKYDIYWYRYEKDYVDESDYCLMPKGWRKLSPEELQNPLTGAPYQSLPDKNLDYSNKPIINSEGFETYAPTVKTNNFIYRYMQNDWEVEKYVAVICYNHKVYKSNELVFYNDDAQEMNQTIATSSKDVLKLEHKANSFPSYMIYNEAYMLNNIDERNKVREIQCHYDGLQAKDEALIQANVYWYIPEAVTMIDYDLNFLIGRGFVTDAPDSEGHRSFFDQSKQGYICFYKQIQGTESIVNDKPVYNFENNNSYDDRSFWYKIKPIYQPTVFNHIICKVIINQQPVGIEQLINFTFGTFGTQGTDYTLLIESQNNKPLAFLECGKEDLKLKISLRDKENNEVELEKRPTLTWIYIKKEEEEERDPPLVNTYAFDKDSNNNFTLFKQENYGYLQAEVEIDNNIILKCLQPIGLSAHNSIVAEGNPCIVYNNMGTIDQEYSLSGECKMLLWPNATYVNNPSWEIQYYKLITHEGNLCLERIIKPSDSPPDSPLDKIEWERNKSAYEFYTNYITIEDNRLKLSPIYINNLDDIYPILYGYGATDGQIHYCHQPLIISQHRYPSKLLNDWDGEFKIDNENGTIMSSMVAAGQKNLDNSFSGVLMGNVSLEAGLGTENTLFDIGKHSGLGLYGFHNGEQSFGFNADGTAFLGKSSGGRIIFNGDYGAIASANWFAGGGRITWDSGQSKYITTPSTAGMCIDLQEGHIDAYNFKLSSNNIYLNSNPIDTTDPNSKDSYYFYVGSNESGYMSFDKDGVLRLQVNELYLTGNLGGTNLLKQTNYLPDDSRDCVWGEQFGSLSQNTDDLIENSYLTLGSTAAAKKSYVTQDVALEADKIYTLSGYTHLSQQNVENPILFGIYYKNNGLYWAPLDVKKIINGVAESDHCCLPANDKWNYFSCTFSIEGTDAVKAALNTHKHLTFTIQQLNEVLYTGSFQKGNINVTFIKPQKSSDIQTNVLKNIASTEQNLLIQIEDNCGEDSGHKAKQYFYDHVSHTIAVDGTTIKLYIGDQERLNGSPPFNDTQPFCFEFIYDTDEKKYNLSRCSLKKEVFYGDNINHKYKLWIVRNPKALDFKHLKLEEGMYASAWSPAIGDSVLSTGGLTKLQMFDSLFKETQGIQMHSDGKVYISAEVIQTGLLKSANYTNPGGGAINDNGEITDVPSEGMCIDLNHGTISTPFFSISQKITNGSSRDVDISGKLSGWSLEPRRLYYSTPQLTKDQYVPITNTLFGVDLLWHNHYFDDDDVNIYAKVWRDTSENTNLIYQKINYTDLGNDYPYEIVQLELTKDQWDTIVDKTGCDDPTFRIKCSAPETYVKVETTSVDTEIISDTTIPILIPYPVLVVDFTAFASYYESGNTLSLKAAHVETSMTETTLDATWSFIRQFTSTEDEVPDLEEDGQPVKGNGCTSIRFTGYVDKNLLPDSLTPAQRIEILKQSIVLEVLMPQYSWPQKQYWICPSPDYEQDLISDKYIISFGSNINDTNPQKGDFNILREDGSVIIGSNDGNQSILSRGKLQFKNNTAVNNMYTVEILSNGRVKHTIDATSTYDYYRGSEKVFAIGKGHYASILLTNTNAQNIYAGLTHFRSAPGSADGKIGGFNNAMVKFGCGSIWGKNFYNPSGSIEVQEQNAQGAYRITARLDVYRYDQNYIGLMISDGAGGFQPLFFRRKNKKDAAECVFLGTWKAKLATFQELNLNSRESIKKNIVKPKNKILNLFEKNQSEIYSYNLKNKNILTDKTDELSSVHNDKSIKYGFVIGDNYKVPEEVLSDDRNSINIYSMASLNWAATQELYELYKNLSSQIDGLKNGEKGEINNENDK